MIDRRSSGQLRWRLAPLHEFKARAAQWDALVGSAHYPPFLKADFLLPALQEFGAGDERIALYGRDDQPAAMAVIRRSGRGRWETFQPSQLPLGAFVHDGCQPLEETLQRLLQFLPGIAVMFALTQQDPDFVPRPPDTSHLRSLDYIPTARVVVETSFDGYWAARGKNLRTNVKRQLAKLAQDKRTLRLEVVDDPDDVQDAIAEYGRLETAGWKQADGTAVAVDNAQGRFYVQMLKAFCRAGKGHIYRCRIDERIAAIDLSIEGDGVVVVLKTAYDEAFASISPATLMRYQYFQLLFNGGGVRRIEFYGRVMEWHRRWTQDVRMLYHINVYRSALLRTLHERINRQAGMPGRSC
jgi:CelD/BcsL family acetyltransferase involved in cellulose biosynthesis